MKRFIFVLSAFAVITFASCDNDQVAQPSPAPTTVGPAGRVPAGVLPPVDRARDTVNQLNDLQNRTEQQTGDDTYTAPTAP